MTDAMVKIAADRLAQVFLLLRRSSEGGAQAAAEQLQTFTEKPGQRVPVPRSTVLQAEKALNRELEQETEAARRLLLSQMSHYLGSARLE
ncbi:hypothetical protein [Streptomyces sp. cmx-4-9]|uniref:hypothetical protein n=1 Tax=Streptomyces sp. cmx-4-9 TaxID=2790941 RepID=UPI00397F7220